MNFIDLRRKWRLFSNDPKAGQSIDLPFDVLKTAARDYRLKGGEKYGYYPSQSLRIVKSVQIPKCAAAFLEIEGVTDLADVYINGIYIDCVTHKSKKLIDLKEYIQSECEIRLDLHYRQGSHKYLGLGISSGVRLLLIDSDLFIGDGDVFVSTVSDGDKAELSVKATVTNASARARSFILNAEIYNGKNKRVTKKRRKLKLPANSSKEFVLPIKIIRHYIWSGSDAYLYTAQVRIEENDKVLDAQKTAFGIRNLKFDADGGFEISSKPFRFKGAYISHDNGALGMASVASAEMRKLKMLKEAGFNSIRYTSVPSSEALESADKLGLKCIVDLFDGLRQPKSGADGHAFFDGNYSEIIVSSIKTLRNHPCVVAYGVCDCAEESYNRGAGAQLIREIVSKIKQLDNTRPVIASACELAPLKSELIGAGVKADKLKGLDENALLSLSREKNLFRDCTKEYFACADIAGYSLLYQRYQADKLYFNRPTLGVKSESGRIYDSIEEAEKNGVLGDFAYPAVDLLGGALESGDGLSGARCSVSGDFDLTGFRRAQSYYREICFGAKNKSYIVAVEPEEEGAEAKQPVHSWNFPRFVGKPVTVYVYTSGDVVALYLDSKLVGRKLAGKMNKHIATFKINYYPGKLEAVSFHRGLEHARCQLESVSAPKAIKIVCDDKNVSLSGDSYAYAEIYITDKNANAVTKAQREVEVTVSEGGQLVSLTNADPFLSLSCDEKTCPVFEGRALAVVKGTAEGKFTVKVTGEGLLSNKITVKVKP